MTVSRDLCHSLSLQFASLVGQIQTVTHCGSSEPGAALQELALKGEELQSVLGKMSSLKSLVQAQKEELASIRTAVQEKDGDVEKGQALLNSTKEELETSRADAALLEASLVEVKQALQVVRQRSDGCMLGRQYMCSRCHVHTQSSCDTELPMYMYDCICYMYACILWKPITQCTWVSQLYTCTSIMHAYVYVRTCCIMWL